ncbi:MAG TPA: helix-turn-helix transcriptional regulator [Anaeromyxobacteraceae bacterium]|nr:helix-turn-helix transcriptional regulator [Anaeromyxobacteraceae bacterium]
MGRKFSDFMKEVEAETRREGPKAVAEMEAFKAHFKLAAELILLRRRRGLSQRQLSAKSGIQQAEISRIESGRANPTLGTISVLARALGGDLRLAAAGKRKPPTRTAARAAGPRRA